LEEVEQFEMYFARLVDELNVRGGKMRRVKNNICIFFLTHWLIFPEGSRLAGVKSRVLFQIYYV
jgi:hypothetical protein